VNSGHHQNGPRRGRFPLRPLQQRAPAGMGEEGASPAPAAKKGSGDQEECAWCKYMKGGGCREPFEVGRGAGRRRAWAQRARRAARSARGARRAAPRPRMRSRGAAPPRRWRPHRGRRHAAAGAVAPGADSPPAVGTRSPCASRRSPAATPLRPFPRGHAQPHPTRRGRHASTPSWGRTSTTPRARPRSTSAAAWCAGAGPRGAGPARQGPRRRRARATAAPTEPPRGSRAPPAFLTRLLLQPPRNTPDQAPV
jgi:hypothetical protein